MRREIVSTMAAPHPGGAYSQAVAVGDLVFTSSLVPTDPGTGQIVTPDDIEAQTRQVLRNLRAVLEAAGSSLECTVHITAYIDTGRWTQFNTAYGEFFPSSPPARSIVERTRSNDGVCVAMDAVAVRR